VPKSRVSKKNAKHKKSAWRELVETVLWALVIALLIRYFVVEGYYIPSSSMEPTLVPGERVLVAKFYYRFTYHSAAISSFSATLSIVVGILSSV